MVGKERLQGSGFSTIDITATVAVLILVGSMIWQSYTYMQKKNSQLSYAGPVASQTETTTSDQELIDAYNAVVNAPSQQLSSSTTAVGSAVIDHIINAYVTLKNQNSYTPENARAVGDMMAPLIRTDLSYKTFSLDDIATSSDMSSQAGFAYRAALQSAIAPLKENKAPELSFLGKYLDTKDTSYLDQLSSVASLYAQAADNASRLTVPADVAGLHVNFLDSLEEYSAALVALVKYADHPIEEVAFLRSYTAAEQDVLTSFNAIQLHYANTSN